MDPQALIPISVDSGVTPMGMRPLNRWVQTGAGGGPYQNRGLFPATAATAQGFGPRLAPGYDGLSDGEGEPAPLYVPLLAGAVAGFGMAWYMYGRRGRPRRPPGGWADEVRW